MVEEGQGGVGVNPSENRKHKLKMCVCSAKEKLGLVSLNSGSTLASVGLNS